MTELVLRNPAGIRARCPEALFNLVDEDDRLGLGFAVQNPAHKVLVRIAAADLIKAARLGDNPQPWCLIDFLSLRFPQLIHFKPFGLAHCKACQILGTERRDPDRCIRTALDRFLACVSLSPLADRRDDSPQLLLVRQRIVELDHIVNQFRWKSRNSEQNQSLLGGFEVISEIPYRLDRPRILQEQVRVAHNHRLTVCQLPEVSQEIDQRPAVVLLGQSGQCFGRLDIVLRGSGPTDHIPHNHSDRISEISELLANRFDRRCWVASSYRNQWNASSKCS